MFNPPSPQQSTATILPSDYQLPRHPQSAPPPNTQPHEPAQLPQSPQTRAPQQPNRAKRGAGQVWRILPPEEDMRRLFQECRIAQGNAQLLSEALTFARPEDLREKDIIKVRIRIFLGRSEGAEVYLGMVLEVSQFSGPGCCTNTMGDSRSGSIACCS